AAKPVEDMAHEMWVPGGVDARVVEARGRVLRQSDSLNARAGTPILRHGERHDLVEADLLEADRHGTSCGLRRVAMSPVATRQSPADLDPRAVREVVRRPQDDVADEWRHVGHLDGPEAPAMAVPLHLDPIDER